jgi:type IX secretion system PorP/SprF family membrane protein
MKLKVFLFCFFLAGTFSAYAQQDAMFTHYMFNTQAVNPGYAGSRDALTLTFLHRSQWVGFPGAPTTQTLTLHTPFKRENIGVGLSLMNDNLGPINNTSVYFDFAYRIKLNEKSKLSFGLKGGMNLIQANLNRLNLDDINDQSFQFAGSVLSPNFGFGVYYQHERFYVGLSAPRLLENNLKPVTPASINFQQDRRHYFLIAGAMIKLSEKVEFKPTTYVKMIVGAPIEFDITGTFILNKSIMLGAMFRTGDAVGALIGYNITDQLLLSYSFDWSYGIQTIRHHAGSHEIMLRYDFIFGINQKIKSPRYF